MICFEQVKNSILSQILEYLEKLVRDLDIYHTQTYMYAYIYTYKHSTFFFSSEWI